MPNPHDLQRFLDAQAGVIDQVLAELRGGRKRSRWMWFIFLQVAWLGHSGTAQVFAIRSLDEARAYADHPELGPRLVECTELVLVADTDDPSTFQYAFQSEVASFLLRPPGLPIMISRLSRTWRLR